MAQKIFYEVFIMKRSELNKIIKDGADFMEKMNFKLPPFAFWGPKEWAEKGHEYDEIRDNMLGWDITDFGSGDYLKKGLFLFTVVYQNKNDFIVLTSTDFVDIITKNEQSSRLRI